MMMILMKMRKKTTRGKRSRRRSRNDDRQGARDFALWIGIAQMSRARSGWVRQDVRAGLDRQDLFWGGEQS